MMSPQLLAVLRQLSSEVFISGEVIAKQLGCSRATVNNTIRAAIAEGVPIHAVHGRGYRLASHLTWLDAAKLKSDLAGQGIALCCLDHVPSTNAHLMGWAQNGAPHRAMVTAEWQSEGRGRRGRTWHAGLGSGLMFSFLWRSGRPAAELSGLSLAVGVALVKTLRAAGLAGAGVKWPNDILVDGAKLAGVLIELTGDMLGPSTAIVGVGVNVQGGEQLTGQVGQPVTDLQRHLGAVSRTALFLDLVSGLDAGLALFEESGFSAFQDDWQACHVHQDREVMIHSSHGDAVSGYARGVDEQGALLLETPAGLQRFHSGEVSLRAVGP
jgi:BirA family biotin operon repressor/biotin-[acetyl-CoA-carboxylase] ligase